MRDLLPVHSRKMLRHSLHGLRMARHAILVADAFVIIDLAHFVRLMAVDADRNLVRLFLPEFPVDYLAMHLLDQRVALAARAHHIFPIDARLRIRVRQDMVCRMATRADGRNRQPLFSQALSVNTLLVTLQDVVLWNLPGLGYGRILRVTPTARLRNVDRIGVCLGILRAENVVFPMAIRARGRQWVTLCQRFSVKAFGVNLRLSVMALRAVDMFQLFRMRKFFDVGVA